MKYICYCGCIYKSNDDLVFVRRIENGNRIQQLRCPDHFESDLGNIEKKSMTCPFCGITWDLSIMANEPNACKKCAKKIKEGKIKAWQKTRKEKISAKKLMYFDNIKRARTLEQAQTLGVRCIPLAKLFRLHKRVSA